MTEKTEKRIADTINIVTYVANDGTEFVSKDSCLAYEKKLAEIAERERVYEKKLIVEPFEKMFKCIYADALVWDMDIFVGVLKSAADYEIMKKYIKLNCYEDNTEAPSRYPSPYVFTISESGGYAYTEHTDAVPYKWITKYIDALAGVREQMKEIENAE
jgi:hypothetical protein